MIQIISVARPYAPTSATAPSAADMASSKRKRSCACLDEAVSQHVCSVHGSILIDRMSRRDGQPLLFAILSTNILFVRKASIAHEGTRCRGYEFYMSSLALRKVAVTEGEAALVFFDMPLAQQIWVQGQHASLDTGWSDVATVVLKRVRLLPWTMSSFKIMPRQTAEFKRGKAAALERKTSVPIMLALPDLLLC